MPHFEKMLYDNPQLALTYLDAFRITLAKQRGSSSGSTPAAAAAADAGAALASPVGGSSGSSSGTSGGSGVSTSDEVLYDPRVYATVVRGVLDYLRRDMTHPEGGLYSAEVCRLAVWGAKVFYKHDANVLARVAATRRNYTITFRGSLFNSYKNACCLCQLCV